MTTKPKVATPYPGIIESVERVIRQIQRRQAVTELVLKDSLKMIPGGSLVVADYERKLEAASHEPPFKVGDLVFRTADTQRLCGEIVFWDDLRDIGRAQFSQDGLPVSVWPDIIEKVKVTTDG